MRKSLTINGKLITKYFNTIEEMQSWHNEKCEENSDKSIEGEVWKGIPSFSRYQASSMGRVWSLNYKNSGCRKILSFAKSKDGYMKSVLLNDNGEYKSMTKHKIVCYAFYGKKEPLEINHKDGDKENNSPCNLEWVTRSENCKHAVESGLWIARRGVLNGMSKLSKDQVDYARRLKKEKGRYWGRNNLAKEFGVNPKTLQFIVNNEDKTW